MSVLLSLCIMYTQLSRINYLMCFCSCCGNIKFLTTDIILISSLSWTLIIYQENPYLYPNRACFVRQKGKLEHDLIWLSLGPDPPSTQLKLNLLTSCSEMSYLIVNCCSVLDHVFLHMCKCVSRAWKLISFGYLHFKIRCFFWSEILSNR